MKVHQSPFSVDDAEYSGYSDIHADVLTTEVHKDALPANRPEHLTYNMDSVIVELSADFCL